MPNCDFYAHGDDYAQVLGFVFDQPGWVLHELSSAYDQPIAVFRSAAEVFARCPVGVKHTSFHLHAPEMRGRVVHHRIDFKPGAVEGATHRFTTQGWGLIQLYLGYRRGDGLTHSHTNHNSEVRAQTWAATPATGPLDDPALWDWKAVTRVSGRLNRFVQKLAVTKLKSRPVLPGAQAAVDGGVTLLLNG